MLSTPSYSPAKALRKTVSAGNGPRQWIPRRAASATAGAMISISSRPKRPFSPPWGLSAADALRGDLIERRPERDVRGHPRHPKAVDDVHLAEGPAVAGEVGEQLMLVGEAPSSGMERGLVQRREDDALQVAREREADEVRQRFPADPPGLGGHFAAADRSGIEIAKVDQRDLVTRPVDVVRGGVRFPGDAHPGVSRALLEHPRIANYQKPGGVRQALPIGEDPRADLRPDSGGIAEHQPEHGQDAVGGPVHVGLRSVKR